MLKREDYLKQIDQNLAVLLITIKFRGYQNLYDIHIISEDFIAGLLNIIYGYSLKNMNYLHPNNPGYDLGDETNGIAFQVTAEKKKKKIQGTIDIFIDKRLFETYKQLYFFILKESYKPTSSFDTQGHFDFDKEINILDFKRLIFNINALETEKLAEIVEYLNNEISTPQIDSNHISVIKSFLDELAEVRKLGFNSAEFQSWHKTIQLYLHQSYGEDSYLVNEYAKIAWQTSDKPEDQKEQDELFLQCCVSAEGFLAAMIRVAPSLDTNKENLQPVLDASSVSMYFHNNPPYNAVKMLYTGNEIAKDLEVQIFYKDTNGKEQIKVIEEFFPEKDPKMFWHQNKYDFLKTNQVVYFHLLLRRSVLDDSVLVTVSFVGTNSGNHIKVEREFELIH